MSVLPTSPTTYLSFITTRLLIFSSSVRRAGMRSSIPGLRLAWCPDGLAPCPTAASIASLNDLEAAEFFSVGMRKRNKLGRNRIVSDDLRSERRQGHSGYGRQAVRQRPLLRHGSRRGGASHYRGEHVVEGMSNTYDRIPELLEWCNALAAKIASGRNPRTGSRLDLLSAGQDLERVPVGIIAMAWATDVYIDPPPVFFHRPDGS